MPSSCDGIDVGDAGGERGVGGVGIGHQSQAISHRHCHAIGRQRNGVNRTETSDPKRLTVASASPAVDPHSSPVALPLPCPLLAASLL